MLSIYPLLVLLWSLSSAFAAPVRFGQEPTPRTPNLPRAPPSLAIPPGRAPLRSSKDIYNVVVRGDKYLVYTPYYERNNGAIVTMLFPSDKRDQVIVTDAYTAGEKPHADGSARLHLSDMIEAVASRHAGRSLSSIDTLVIRTIVNPETKEVINDYYVDWKKGQADPRAEFPTTVSVKPSNKFWAAFARTPFFKAANYAFRSSRKSVRSVDIVSKYGTDLWFRMG
ncbi:hypothetical protein LX36DRAFT_743619 [Colletotrichum falcatum]|nr:hypothetical protein LX36DRAFT_743619 [Colletotrichum falcatum]